MKTKVKKETRSRGLVGKFFHSYHDNGRLEYQGKVLSQPNKGVYLVQLYDWIIGSESDQELIKIEDMLRYKFYNSAEDMRYAYEMYERQV
jgi:hypothetical protein